MREAPPGAGFRALTPSVKPQRGGVNTGRRIRLCGAVRSAQRRSSKPGRDGLLFRAETGAQEIVDARRSMGDFDLRASRPHAKSCQRVPPLLEEIERELEIALVLRNMNRGAYDRDGSWRDSRQGGGLDEAGPMNRAVACPGGAEAEVRKLAANRNLP